MANIEFLLILNALKIILVIFALKQLILAKVPFFYKSSELLTSGNHDLGQTIKIINEI